VAIVCRQCGHRNADGVEFCANPSCGAYLIWEGEQGTRSMPIRPAAPGTPGVPGRGTVYGTPTGQLPQVPSGPAVPGALGPPAGASSNGQRAAAGASLAEAALSVAPGETASTTVTVHNGGSQVEEFALTVLGPTAGWASLEPPTVSVYPGERTDCTVRFAPPRTSSTLAGSAWFRVRAVSTVHPDLVAEADGTVEVGAFRELTAVLLPQNTSGRGRTTHRVGLTNSGNVLEPVRVEASDPDGKIRFDRPAGEVPVQPGNVAVDIGVRPKYLFYGRKRSHRFTVLATPRPPVPPVRLDGGRDVVALIPRWLPIVAGVLVLLGAAGAGAVTVGPKLFAASATASAAPSASAAASPSKAASPSASPSAAPCPSPSPSMSSSPAATSTPVPSGTHIRDEVIIQDTGEVDLDRDDGNTADVNFDRTTSPLTGTPENGARLTRPGGVDEMTDTQLAEKCANTRLGKDPVPILMTESHGILCVRTSTGGLSVLTMDTQPNATGGTQLHVGYDTYEN
jgi:hypothetical protein